MKTENKWMEINPEFEFHYYPRVLSLKEIHRIYKRGIAKYRFRKWRKSIIDALMLLIPNNNP